MADEAPQARSGLGIPLPLILGGLGVVAVVVYLHYRNNSAASAAASPATGVSLPTDPNTGLPIDQFTGLPYVTSQPSTATDLTTWIGQAERALVSAGYSPALASQSLYDYANENPLSTSEAGAVNKALALVGFAPQQLPFMGSLPPAPGTPAWKFYSSKAYNALAQSSRANLVPVYRGRVSGYAPSGSHLPTGFRYGPNPHPAR